MKLQRMLIVLTVVNLVLVVMTLSSLRPVAAQGSSSVLRGRALEIVDDQGRVRASISVMPASRQPNGEPYPETVLLRLITERGRPSVKISAAEEQSGLMFAGPTGTKETWLQLGANGTATSLRLKNEDGTERVVKP
jgi:hypothetical protein